MNHLALVFCFLSVLVISPSLKANEVFVSNNKQVAVEVELFEFDNLAQQQQAISLAKTLRCPQCQNQNLIESNSPIAKDLRLHVFKMVKSGKTDTQIIEYMTERYGEFVLYKPAFKMTNGLLWLFPILLLVLFIYLLIKSVKGSP